MPRQPRLDAPGALQHVIARGIEQRAIFIDREDYRFFANRLGQFVTKTDMTCFAWSLLPNHFHLLLQTGPIPLPTFMRRLLTSYSVYFNRRHQRNGHLFQNRYKSIVCQEDPYFLELIRYIHLNPIRSGVVRNLRELERYSWCGEAALMGRALTSWQEVNFVLSWFDRRKTRARTRYRSFMRDGLTQGRRPDLLGSLKQNSGMVGLTASQTDPGEDEPFRDSRILGESPFVQEMLQRQQGSREELPRKCSWNDLLSEVARWADAPLEELTSGSRRPSVVWGRCVLSYLAVRKLAMGCTEVGRLLRVSQPAISKSVLRGEEILKNNERISRRVEKVMNS